MSAHVGDLVEIDGKTWRIAEIRQGRIPWCWIVNTSRPMEQARIPLYKAPKYIKSPESDGEGP